MPDYVDTENNDHFIVYGGDAAGRFRPVSSGSLGPAWAGAQIALVDLNGDGRPELLSADRRRCCSARATAFSERSA